jgi:LPXTG-motif cell wall-anchored protein
LKNLLKYSLFAAALVLALSPRAHAGDKDRRWDKDQHDYQNCDNQAPEVDPSMAFAGLTLLGGTLTVLRSRRRK